MNAASRFLIESVINIKPSGTTKLNDESLVTLMALAIEIIALGEEFDSHNYKYLPKT